MMLEVSCGIDRWEPLLAFRAPWLEERLVKEGIARTQKEAALVVDEVKKLLALVAHEGRRCPSGSRRVEEAWRQFVLYTREYAAFCERFFGEYVHYRDASGIAANADDDADFALAYELSFGPLPPLWDDANAIAVDSRMRRVAGAGAGRGAGFDHARPALAFIDAEEVFCVRELPGLEDDERLALVGALRAAGELELLP